MINCKPLLLTLLQSSIHIPNRVPPIYPSLPMQSIGALGILGPTRMDYAASISAVNAVANYVGRFLTESK